MAELLLEQLFDACREGDVDEVGRQQVAVGQLATAANEQGLTALHEAAFHGRAPIIELLLQAGAQPLHQDYVGKTPLFMAAGMALNAADAVAVRLVLEAAAAAALVPVNGGWLPLHNAASSARPAAVRLLLQAAPEVALQADKQGRHPIDWALLSMLWAANGEEQSAALEAVRCLLVVGDAPFLLAALAKQRPWAQPRTQLLYADLAARLPLTPEQWQRVPAPCAGLLAVGDEPFLLAALSRWPHERAQPLYADVAARVPLTPAQWQRVLVPCTGLLRALPTVLARSEGEAALLVAHLPVCERQRLRQRLLVAAAAAARASPGGVQLPGDARRRVLAAWLADECTAAAADE